MILTNWEINKVSINHLVIFFCEPIKWAQDDFYSTYTNLYKEIWTEILSAEIMWIIIVRRLEIMTG